MTLHPFQKTYFAMSSEIDAVRYHGVKWLDFVLTYCVYIQNLIRLLEIASETAKLLADVDAKHEPVLRALAVEYMQLVAVRSYHSLFWCCNGYGVYSCRMFGKA
jgi:hypothetical protein